MRQIEVESEIFPKMNISARPFDAECQKESIPRIFALFPGVLTMLLRFYILLVGLVTK